MTDSRPGDVLVSYWFFNKKENFTWDVVINGLNRGFSSQVGYNNCGNDFLKRVLASTWVKETHHFFSWSCSGILVNLDAEGQRRIRGGSLWHHTLWHHILSTGLMPRMSKHLAMMVAVASQSSILHMLTFTTSPGERRSILFLCSSVSRFQEQIPDSGPGRWNRNIWSNLFISQQKQST